MPTIDIDNAITTAERRLQPRFVRMDETLTKRYFLEKYVFKIKDKTFKKVESETLPDSRTYADRVIALLGTANRRIEVIHPDQKLADMAEQFINLMLTRAEENLMYSSQLPLEDTQNFFGCIRGTVAGRGILYRDGDVWDCEVLPLDPRGMIYQTGKKGCAITDYKAKRSADDVMRDHPDVPITGDEVEVEDIWTVDQNIVKIAGKREKEVKHPLGLNPNIVVPCPTTPFFLYNADAVKNQASDIYAGAEDMYDELNRVASAWATQNMMGILPTVQYRGKQKAKAEDTYGISQIMNVGDDEGFKEFPIRDMSVSHQRWFGEVMARIQRHTMSNIDYGDLSFELSALAIKGLETKKDQIFIPRLKAKRFFMTMLCYNLIQQFIIGGYPTDLKARGLGKPIDFDPAAFKDANFVIHVDYFAQSPEGNMADLAIANTAKSLGFMPDEYIAKNQLHIEDWTGLYQMKQIEDAAKLSETVAKYRQGVALLGRGRPEDLIEAEIIASEIGMVVQGNTLQPKGKTVIPNPPSQPGIPTGLKMPPVGTPRTPGQTVQKEELRRRGIKETPPRVLPGG